MSAIAPVVLGGAAELAGLFEGGSAVAEGLGAASELYNGVAQASYQAPQQDQVYPVGSNFIASTIPAQNLGNPRTDAAQQRNMQSNANNTFGQVNLDRGDSSTSSQMAAIYDLLRRTQQ